MPLYDLIGGGGIDIVPPDGGEDLIDSAFSVTPLPWGWIIGGLAALILLTVLLIAALKRRKK